MYQADSSHPTSYQARIPHPSNSLLHQIHPAAPPVPTTQPNGRLARKYNLSHIRGLAQLAVTAMDGYAGDVVQARRSSVKRAWEEVDVSQANGEWHATVLPPIEVVPYRRSSGPMAEDSAGGRRADGRDSVVKKTRYCGESYNVFRLEETVESKAALTSTPNLSRIPQDFATGLRNPSIERWGRTPDTGNSAESHHDTTTTTKLCIRCKRSTAQDTEALHTLVENCEQCKMNPELAWVTQAAAAGLTQLVETLSSGTSSQRRGVIIRGPEQRRVGSADCPPIAQFGLKQTLNWLLGRINLVNTLADQLVKALPPDVVAFNFDKDGGIVRNDTLYDVNLVMKRRSSSDVRADDLPDQNYDARSYSRRRSSGTTNSGEELPPIRSHPGYGPLESPGLHGQRSSFMNPPPAPHRQLPSPGRSLPSPTSLDLPSPSHRPYGQLQHLNFPTPTSQHHPSTYLPSISTAPSSTSTTTSTDHTTTHALRDHTATLQHEISLQKLALSTLQSEHDKLLAAFSRSQTRASALEKKHAVSDTEIITLTEEKLRLQSQVLELEKEVEELARARDEARETAVKEGRQYVRIVEMASALEMKGREERVVWEDERRGLEGRIEALMARRGSFEGGIGGAQATMVIADDIHFPSSPNKALRQHPSSIETIKIEPHPSPSPASPPAATAQIPSSAYPSELSSRTHAEVALREEIRRLRRRCQEVEDILKTVRDEGREVEMLISRVVGRARGAVGESEDENDDGVELVDGMI